jgi:hypothetical protein
MLPLKGRLFNELLRRALWWRIRFSYRRRRTEHPVFPSIEAAEGVLFHRSKFNRIKISIQDHL